MNKHRVPLRSVANMSVRSGVANLDEHVGLHCPIRIGVEIDRVSATVAGVQDPFPAAVEVLFIVGDKLLPGVQRVQPHRLCFLVIPDVPEASSVDWSRMLLIESWSFRQGFHRAMLQSSPRRKWFSLPSSAPGIEPLRLMTFSDRLLFCASEIVFAPAVAAGAAAVSAASAIAAFVFHFLQCVAGVRSRSMVAEQNASRPSTNALTAYLGTSGRSPQSVESIL